MIQYSKYQIDILKWQDRILVEKENQLDAFLSGSGFRDAEGNSKMRSCLQEAVINYAPRIGKFINKEELYRQFPPIRVKDIKMTEI